MKIEIKLLSDMCTTSGDGYNSIVDTDVVYDEHGIPYIPAKRIKGCIREAALELRDMGIVSFEQYKHVFGEKGNIQSSFTLSNAYVENYDLMVKEINAFDDKSVISTQNVLDLFTYIRRQTSVNLDTGVAEKNSLRAMRVIKKNLKFVADCHAASEEDRTVLKKAVSVVKHMGMSRTTGLGLVNLELIENDNIDVYAPKASLQYDFSKLSEKNKIDYTIYLKSSLICKSAQGNQAVTQDYIAGGKVLGLIAGALGSAGYNELMAQNDVIVSNAYISTENGRCIPGPISLQKEKDTFGNEDGSINLTDMLYSNIIQWKQMSPAGVDYADNKNCITSVDTQITYHHRRPEDKSVGRTTGVDESSFYQLASIEAGQAFKGYILAGKNSAQKIITALETLSNIRMGYGKTSEFGTVDFTIDAVHEIADKAESVNDAVVELVSDAILYNRSGVASTNVETLLEYICECLDISDTSIIQINKPFLCFNTIGGYNVTWGCRKPIINAIGKGSVFKIHSDQVFDVGKLNHMFIGERTFEGFGELIASKCTGKAETKYRKYKKSDYTKKNILGKEKSGVIDKLLCNEYKRKITENIYSINLEKEIGNSSDKLNAAVAKLRAIYKSTNSYEDMKVQIAGIEDDSKRKLCNIIVAARMKINDNKNDTDNVRHICINDIATYTYKEMNKQLENYKFDSPWKAEAEYKYVYRVYLSELKHYLKIKNGGEQSEQ